MWFGVMSSKNILSYSHCVAVVFPPLWRTRDWVCFAQENGSIVYSCKLKNMPDVYKMYFAIYDIICILLIYLFPQ